MIPEMTFDYITWEAFATILAGALAIAAAIYVGRKQTDISKAQTEILARQAETARHQLRMDLFQSRYEIYDTAKDLFAQVLMPNGSVDFDTYKQFRQHIRKIRFLFGKEIGREIELAWVSVDHIIGFDEDGASYRAKDVLGPPDRHVDRLEATFKDMTNKMNPFLDLSSIR